MNGTGNHAMDQLPILNYVGFRTLPDAAEAENGCDRYLVSQVGSAQPMASHLKLPCWQLCISRSSQVWFALALITALCTTRPSHLYCVKKTSPTHSNCYHYYHKDSSINSFCSANVTSQIKCSRSIITMYYWLCGILNIYNFNLNQNCVLVWYNVCLCLDIVNAVVC